MPIRLAVVLSIATQQPHIWYKFNTGLEGINQIQGAPAVVTEI